ncbi:MAG: hypothetical protein JWQ35_1340 [Bacteriovoracaceae bacterium]|nr:hypothetical protein [Bacteriovoracaceae bacterium]
MWQKKGLVFVASAQKPWMESHAYVPTPWRKDSQTIRVYVSFLDRDGRGRVGFVDVDADRPEVVLEYSKNPVIDLGSTDSFYADGVSPSSIVEVDGKLFLFFMGWKRGKYPPYQISTGLAVSVDRGETFEVIKDKPVMPLTPEDPDLRSAAFVQHIHDHFYAWYVGGEGWEEINGKPVPKTNIRFMKSSNLLDWKNRGEDILKIDHSTIQGFARPWVYKKNNHWELWVGERSKQNTYRLVYFNSEDGLNWDGPNIPQGLEKSSSGWDSEMVAAPAVLEVNSHRILFYNGNQFGGTGFGVAEEVD